MIVYDKEINVKVWLNSGNWIDPTKFRTGNLQTAIAGASQTQKSRAIPPGQSFKEINAMRISRRFHAYPITPIPNSSR